jgi:integrase
MSKQHSHKPRVLKREEVNGIAVRKTADGYWQVDFQREGRRYRKAFKTLEKAKADAASMKRKVVNQGVEVLDISPRQRLDYLETVKLLQGTGASLLDVVHDYLRRHPPAGSETVRQTCDKYLAAMRAASRRPLSVYEKELKFNALCEVHGATCTSGLDEAALEEWAKARGVSAGTEAAYVKSAHNLLAFFRRGGRLKEGAKRDEAPPVTWNVETVGKIMVTSEDEAPEIVAAFAVLFFAGLRPHEVFRLTWKQVDLEAGVIRLTGEDTKTHSMRNVEISANLRAWLKAYPGTGMLAPNRTQYRFRQEKVAKAAGLDGWPVDVARHTFATMHYNAHQNAAATMAQLGHFGNPTTFLRHYKGVQASPAEVKAFWELKPKKEQGEQKVLQFATAG